MNRFRIRIAFAGKSKSRKQNKNTCSNKESQPGGGGGGGGQLVNPRSPADWTRVSAQFPSCSNMAGFGNRLPDRLWAIWAMMEIDNWSTRAHDMQSSSAWALCRRKKKSRCNIYVVINRFVGYFCGGVSLYAIDRDRSMLM